MRIAFRFRWVPLIATLLLAALGIALGQWQDRRAAEKTALQARLAAGAAGAPLVLDGAAIPAGQADFRTVRASGRFIAGWPVFLNNRPYQGRPGFYLLMPFKISGSDMHVLVARGWLPRDPADPARLPAYGTPAAEVTIDGAARPHAARLMDLGTPPPLQARAIVQNADVDAVARASGLKLLPFIVEQAAPAGADDGGIVHDWPAPTVDVDKHKGYAFQWYALAAMALVFFVATGFKSGSKNKQ